MAENKDLNKALEATTLQAPVSAPVVEAGQGEMQDDPVQGKGPTLKNVIDRYFTDYRLNPKYKKNTENSTKKDLPRLISYFGENRDVTTITVAEAEDFVDSVSCSMTKRKKNPKPMTEAGAYSIYRSVVRVIQHAVAQGLIPENVFTQIDEVHIPIPERKDGPGARVDEDQMKKIIDAMIKCKAVFSAVRNVLFIVMAYTCHISPGDLLVLTWPDVDQAKDSGKLSVWVLRLLDSYRPAQEKWLRDNGIVNPKGYVFVNNNAEAGVAVSAAAGTAGTWLRQQILDPLKLPHVTINVLSSKTEGLTPQNGFEGLDPQADYPIFGPVTFPEKTFGRKLTPEEVARKKAGRAACRKAYMDKKGGAN